MTNTQNIVNDLTMLAASIETGQSTPTVLLCWQKEAEGRPDADEFKVRFASGLDLDEMQTGNMMCTIAFTILQTLLFHEHGEICVMEANDLDAAQYDNKLNAPVGPPADA